MRLGLPPLLLVIAVTGSGNAHGLDKTSAVTENLPKGCVDRSETPSRKGSRTIDITRLLGFTHKEHGQLARDVSAIPQPESPEALAAELPARDFSLGSIQYYSRGDSQGASYLRADRKVPITGMTLLWLARMLYGEVNGHPRAHQIQVLWTVIHRFQFHPYYWNLSDKKPHLNLEDHIRYFMQQFSQPINVNFNLGGSRCPRVGFNEDCSKEMIAHRVKVQNMEWKNIPAEFRKLAVEFALGQVSQPANLAHRAINFGNADVTKCDDGEEVAFYMSKYTPEPSKTRPDLPGEVIEERRSKAIAKANADLKALPTPKAAKAKTAIALERDKIQKKLQGKLDKLATGKDEAVHLFCQSRDDAHPKVEIMPPPWLDCEDDDNGEVAPATTEAYASALERIKESAGADVERSLGGKSPSTPECGERAPAAAAAIAKSSQARLKQAVDGFWPSAKAAFRAGLANPSGRKILEFFR